jgi:hypothetical protein
MNTEKEKVLKFLKDIAENRLEISDKFKEVIFKADLNMVFSKKDIGLFSSQKKEESYTIIKFLLIYKHQALNSLELYQLLNKCNINQQDQSGWMPMMYFLVHHRNYSLNKKQIYHLLKKCNLNLKNDEGQTVLMRLLMEKPLLIEKEDLISLLMNENINQKDQNNNSLFSYLLLYNQIKLFNKEETKLLLNKVDFLLKDNIKTTILEQIIHSYLENNINIEKKEIIDIFNQLNKKNQEEIFKNVIDKIILKEYKKCMMFLSVTCVKLRPSGRRYKQDKKVYLLIEKGLDFFQS